MGRKKLRYAVMLLLFLFITSGWLALVQFDQHTHMVSYGRDELIRLHVVANSDSMQDQQLKLKVRDAIIAYLAPYLEEVTDVVSAREVIVSRQDEIVKIAQDVLVADAANYSVRLQMGWFEFPVKSYGSFVLPAGRYEAVKIMLGKAEGKNWWCVLFPPLCFVDVSHATATSIIGTQQERTENVEIRWKLAELFSQSQ